MDYYYLLALLLWHTLHHRNGHEEIHKTKLDKQKKK